MRPSHILLPMVSHAVDTARAPRGTNFITVLETLGETSHFCLCYNRVARVGSNSVALLRGFSQQVSP